MTKELELFKANGSWMMKNNDPKVMNLFGTDTLPTAFTSRAAMDDVLESIKELNPNAKVTVCLRDAVESLMMFSITELDEIFSLLTGDTLTNFLVCCEELELDLTDDDVLELLELTPIISKED